MKKILSLVAMLLMVLSTNAQQQEAGTFSISPKAGVGVGFINTNYLNDDYPTSGLTFTIGADAQYQINDLVGISAGLEYRYFRTSKYEYNSHDEWSSSGSYYSYDYIEDTYKSSYYHGGILSIPIIAHFSIGKHLGAFVGIQPEIILSAKSENEYSSTETKITTGRYSGTTTDTSSDSYSYTSDLQKARGIYYDSNNRIDRTVEDDYNLDAISRFNLSIPVGFQWTFNSPLVLSVKYNIGLTNILKSDVLTYKRGNNESYFNEEGKYHANLGSLIATVAYRFDL